ncbi:hypothetical protein VSX61_09805 [Brenneria populi subsp. brevivirga]|uniref:hypothetical protein n=1 Tax=Brenneria populi TaxID=1505588 RepID=UPI002E177A24|nr:hypothetical protein [Brenneria populi subsp. brevivirga]
MSLSWKRPLSFSPVRLAHALGLCAAVAGIGFWAYMLHQPAAQTTTRVDAAGPAADPAGGAVAQWLGPGRIRMDIVVVGLILRRDRAVAVLAVNGAAPKAYMAGEELALGVTLDAIDATGVTLGRSDGAVRIAAPALSDKDAPGIERVP